MTGDLSHYDVITDVIVGRRQIKTLKKTTRFGVPNSQRTQNKKSSDSMVC